jgi:hypothetical protein
VRTYVTGLSYLTGNQSITVSGDATGSGTTAITLTLANTAVTPGTYGSTTLVPVVTVDAKGRITSVTTAAISGSLTFTGDVTGTGTTGTSTGLTLAASGVTAGTYTKVTVDTKGRVTVGASATTSDISEGTNLYYTDARVLAYLGANNYATQSYVGTQIANLVSSAPATLDTLNELAAALGNDPSFATTTATSLGNRLRVDTAAQGLNSTQQGNGRTNLGLGSAALSASGDFATAAQGTKADTAHGWGNHASGGYLTSATAATTYASLTGAYANPAFVASLAYSKITGVPAFLTSYTETDPYRVTSVAVSGTSTKTITLTRADASTVTTTWTDYDTDTNTYVTSAGFSGGNLTLTRNDTGQITVSLDGRYYLATNPSGYITSSGSISGTAGSISGFNNPTTTASANTIVYRDANGYIDAVYFKSTNTNVTTTAPVSITGKSSGDSYMYEYSQAAVRSFLGLGSLAYSSATIPTNNNQLTNGAGYIGINNQTYFGINNTSNSSGNGISLYGAYSGGEMNYGIMFAGTPTFGTHGSVTGDWATYFTMNADNARGWIFRKAGSANVASISGGGNASFTGTISASNLSGTNTGDQTNISGTASNITAYTINQSVGTGNAPTFTNIYNNAWFRNNNVNEGVYNQATGVHFYSHAATGWTVTGSGGIAEIVFRSNHQTTIRGYVYADTSNQIGFLTNDGNWGLQVDSSKNVKVFGTDLTVGNTTSSNIYMTDTDESTRRIHCNSGRIGFLTTANGWGAYCDNSGNWFANNLSGTNTGDQTNISGNAATAGGLAVHTDRNNEANKIVRTDVNGYIQAGWINTLSGDNGTSAITRIYASDDGYIRYYTPANFRQVLDVPTRTGGSASGSWGINAATATGQQSGAHFTVNTGGGGYGLVGVYNPDIHQGLFAMGPAYTLAAGGTLANFYGVSWSYDYSGRQLNTGYNLQHCMAVANAGVVATVIGLGIWTNGTIRANGNISAANLSGTNTGDQTNISGRAGSTLNFFATSHPNDYYLVNNWTGTYWRITSNHPSGVQVAYADTAGSAPANGGTSSNTNSISNALGNTHTWTGAQNNFLGNGNTGGTNNVGMVIYSTGGNGSQFSFHRSGAYAINMGLDSDNVIRIGGWSASPNRFQMDMSGNLTMSGDVTAYSDARVKENIATIENALNKVLALRGVSYNRIDSDDKKTKIGVIAQETLPIVPEVVNQDNDGMYNVSYGNLAGLFIEAIKEQQKEIEELKTLIYGITR